MSQNKVSTLFLVITFTTCTALMGQQSPINCNPLPNPNHDQYIIGYGSLMKEESKVKTLPHSGDSIPIIIEGFRREWNAQGPTVHSSCTYLGVVHDSNSSFNAVTFKLKIPSIQEQLHNSLSHFDNLIQMFQRLHKREDYYCRQRVPNENISPLINTTEIEGSINTTNSGIDYWIYVNRPEFTNYPNEKYPIVQSYVDIFISGCLQLEQKWNLTNFTNTCVNSTKGWDVGKWVNDRLYPRRSFLYQPKAYQIDKALARNIPSAYANIQFEG